MSKLLRKGRLKAARRDVVKFTSSINSDRKLLEPVIAINKAHIIMLTEKGILDRTQGSEILRALSKLDEGVKLRQGLEDVHMAVEEEVIKAVGPEIGGNLHIAKSRNDQVSTAIRMALRGELICLMDSIVELQEALIHTSEKNHETIIPGYTHLQPAQPITFAHYLLSQFDAHARSLRRVEEAYSRVDQCPMGAGALATTSFPISRERVAELLGFSGILENSIDAVSSRDFLLEVLALLTIMAVDVSRFVEDLIVWTTLEFGTIELPDEFSSTSSIMPQKKNPEVLEIIRARANSVLGNFVASATMIKALPSGYNLDFQEVTPKLWDAIETVNDSLGMLSKLLPNLKVKLDFSDKPSLSFLTSTELANMLVREHGVPFRTAHMIVGALVRTLIKEGRTLWDVTPELLAEVSQRFLGTPLKASAKEIHRAVEPSGFIESHKVRGGPYKGEVERMIKVRRKSMALSRSRTSEKAHRLEEAQRILDSVVKSYLAASTSNRNV